MKTKCHVYKSANKAETYLYLKVNHKIEDLPEGLQQLLGELTRFLSLDLSEKTKLARVKVSDVIAGLDHQGFFLQMPPGEHLQAQTPGSGYIQ